MYPQNEEMKKEGRELMVVVVCKERYTIKKKIKKK